MADSDRTLDDASRVDEPHLEVVSTDPEEHRQVVEAWRTLLTGLRARRSSSEEDQDPA